MPNLKFQILFLLFATTVAHAQTTQPNVYFGNLHAHTAVSDGSGTPDEAYTYARHTAKLDFLALTEHNHLMGGDKAAPELREKMYADLIATADKHNAPGQFVSIYGQEFSSSSKGNHVNVFDIKEVIPVAQVPNGDFVKFLAWIKAHPDSSGQTPIVQMNHPGLGYPPGKIGKNEYGRDDFGGDANWVKEMSAVIATIEILNGDPLKGALKKASAQMMEAQFKLFLQVGFKFAPVGDQDNHKPDWGSLTDTRTAILAPELTRPALLNAIRRRHCYATEDSNLKLIFRINDQLMGEEIPMPVDGQLKLSYTIEDADEPDAEYVLDQFVGVVNGREAESAKFYLMKGNASGTISLEGIEAKPGTYLYFRVTQKSASGPDRAWTAPVWVK